ncbi:hypothetical protein [Paenibacillus tianjinensis]|uniref:Uncharacterized protein n=1 Tax=Paenibacillus tianjinensis TaxID=2810347 RepID=A0ABX7L7P0_9BACL|nr:hypothetical protein [Paenibacillus tianjinensis]QSF43009.1 hypothetical protein JRJ22_17115 [Paenibacillus tianjinensis]
MSIFKDYMETDNFEDLIKFSRGGVPPEIDQIKTESNGNLTLLGKFFVSPFILYGENSEISIPIIDADIEKIVVEEIAGHFLKVRKITKGNLIEITLKDVKPSSREKFVNSAKDMPPMIIDIFGSNFSNKEKKVNLTNYRTKQIELDLGKINKISDDQTSEIWDFISSTFLKVEPYFLFKPSNWECNEELKNHIAIKNFASVCKKIWFNVNLETNEITSVGLR